MTEKLHKFREWFYEQKYGYEQAQQYIGMLNFVLLIIATSDKFAGLFHVKNSIYFTLGLTLFGLLSIWGFSRFLVKVIKNQQYQELQVMKNSPIWNRIFNSLDRIEGEIKK